MLGTNPFDGRIMAWIQENLHNPATDALFPVITYLGEAGAFWLAVALFLLIGKRTRRIGLFMWLAIALGFLCGELVVKNIVCRPRPFQDFPGYVSLLIPPPSGWSFPSGHSCASFAAASVICFYSKKWGVPALILAGLIAFSRVFLFVHWPTDVLAGVAFGLAAALLTLLVIRPRLEKRFPNLAER